MLAVYHDSGIEATFKRAKVAHRNQEHVRVEITRLEVGSDG